jgi:hypothetical protein
VREESPLLGAVTLRRLVKTENTYLVREESTLLGAVTLRRQVKIEKT